MPRVPEREGVAQLREVGDAIYGGSSPRSRSGARPPSSQARTVAALKGFFRFMVEEEIDCDPALVLADAKEA